MTVEPDPDREKVCHRYSVQVAATRLELGPLWPTEARKDTLRKARSLPTYDRLTDTVVVCWYVDSVSATDADTSIRTVAGSVTA